MIRWPFGRKAPPAKATAVREHEPAGEAAAHPVPDEAPDAWIERGRELVAQRRYDDAVALLDGVIARQPLNLVALYDRANAWYSAGRLDAAAGACERALDALPGQPDLLMLRGAVAASAHDPEGALRWFERARARRPDLPGLHARIGEQLAFLGRGRESIASYDRALALEPDNFALGSSRLFLLNHFGLLSRDALFDEHRAWGRRLEAAVAHRRVPHGNDRDPDRPLHVGFVSPDLRNHPIAFWLEGYLAGRRVHGHVLHAFDASPFAEDDVTQRLRGRFDHWHRCGRLDDDGIAELVRQSAIDVLVDLAGHTGHHRLGVFARKPAPVQVGWFGYMNTTGLSTIDWRLTDAAHDPPGSEAFYTERLWCLPFLACFAPHPSSPAPGGLPADRRGHVTFGSMNNWAKVSDATKDTWASLLGMRPGSKLRVLVRGAEEPTVASGVRDQFASRGIDPARIEVRPFLPLEAFLREFADIDIALDPFPYGGGTTTLHTLWMGVPIVALEGDSELGRATPATLRGVGLERLVATTPEAYASIAALASDDRDYLRTARSSLRDRIRASAAMDYDGLARNVDGAFASMWSGWCRDPGATASPRA